MAIPFLWLFLPLDRVAARVHGKIRQFVGFLVVFTANVPDREVGNVRDPAQGVVVEKADAFVLHLIFAIYLFNHELRIGVDLKFFAAREHSNAVRRAEYSA